MSYPQFPQAPSYMRLYATIVAIILVMLVLIGCAAHLIEIHSTAYWLGRLIGMGIGACIIALALIVP